MLHIYLYSPSLFIYSFIHPIDTYRIPAFTKCNIPGQLTAHTHTHTQTLYSHMTLPRGLVSCSVSTRLPSDRGFAAVARASERAPRGGLVDLGAGPAGLDAAVGHRQAVLALEDFLKGGAEWHGRAQVSASRWPCLFFVLFQKSI